MNKTTWIILAIIGVTALTAIADAFFKFASERERPILNGWFALGFVHYAASSFGVVYLMRHIKLTSFGIVYAVVDVVLLALIGFFVFRERLTQQEWIGVVLGVISLCLLARSEEG
jgi:drug/metabolite transporter (DMT)-like permease